MRPGIFLFLAALLSGLIAPGMALAQGGVQPLDRLLPEIRRNNPGRFYDAEPRRGADGREEYRLKWMTPDGRILFLDADARTGRVTRRSQDRDAFDTDRGQRREFEDRRASPAWADEARRNEERGRRNFGYENRQQFREQWNDEGRGNFGRQNERQSERQNGRSFDGPVERRLVNPFARPQGGDRGGDGNRGRRNWNRGGDDR